MNFWWTWGIAKKTRAQAAVLFEAINTAARQPVLFTDGGVPDTIDGRFQLLGLFTALAMTRIADKKLRQALFDTFFMTCEIALREMGIGDLGIPYKLKAMMIAFHAHGKIYEACLRGESDWADPLRRNVYGTVEHVTDAQVQIIVDAVHEFMKDPKQAAA